MASCKDAVGVRQDQLPGRYCKKQNNKCQSLKCYEEACYGFAIDSSCNSHSDCNPNSYCAQLDYFPFESVCTAYKKDLETC